MPLRINSNWTIEQRLQEINEYLSFVDRINVTTVYEVIQECKRILKDMFSEKNSQTIALFLSTVWIMLDELEMNEKYLWGEVSAQTQVLGEDIRKILKDENVPRPEQEKEKTGIGAKLTLEELRHLVNKPVYIYNLRWKEGEWKIFKGFDVLIETKIATFDDCCCHYKALCDYGEKWIAYRYEL